jgi:capping protein alpha
MVPDGIESVSEEEKVRIVSDFIYHSPPGEFNEVFNDVRILSNNDAVLKEGVSRALTKYNKEQLTPVKIENSQYQVLITEHNDLGECRFFDPRSKKSFKYDHLRMEASEYEVWEAEPNTESWRSSIEKEMDSYLLRHYVSGVSSVFARKESDNFVVIACIESHKFQSIKYFNGRWRSQWVISIGNSKVYVKGTLKVQVHYFEDGNVQLVCSKEVQEEELPISTEELTAEEVLKHIENEENAYQLAIYECYQTMSDTTFKALRRQLPVTRTKIDWNKIMNYNICKELKASD